MSLSAADQERVAAALARAERLRRLRGYWAASEGLAESVDSIHELRVALAWRPLPLGALVPMPTPPRREGQMIVPATTYALNMTPAHPGLADLPPGAGAWWFRREKKREAVTYHQPKGRRKWDLAHREVELATGWPA